MKLNTLNLTWEINPEDPHFLFLKVDGIVWKEVFKNIFFRHLSSLKNQNNLEESFNCLEDKLCKLEAYKLLALKGRLKKELNEKLSLKKFSQRAILKVIEECERLGYLNDKEESLRLAKRLQKKGYGPAYIFAKMRLQGASYPSEEMQDPVVIIQSLLEKKYRGVSKEKIISSLLRRGFQYDTILDALNSQGFYKKEKGL